MAETKKARSARKRGELRYQLECFRRARRAAALHAIRLEPIPDAVAREVSFHGLNVAELVDEMERADG